MLWNPDGFAPVRLLLSDLEDCWYERKDRKVAVKRPTWRSALREGFWSRSAYRLHLEREGQRRSLSQALWDRLSQEDLQSAQQWRLSGKPWTCWEAGVMGGVFDPEDWVSGPPGSARH